VSQPATICAHTHRGLSKHYETLKGAANGVSLPHLKQLGAAACVGLGVPKIRAAKLFKQVTKQRVAQLLQNTLSFFRA